MGTTGPEPDLRKRALILLRTAVGSPTAEFHPDQWEAVEALLGRERLLVVERTGWGKSMVYFLCRTPSSRTRSWMYPPDFSVALFNAESD